MIFVSIFMSTQLINQVIELTNAEREKAGLKPLTLNNELAQAAQGHSESMATDDFFSHTGADGSNVSDRVEDAGYEYSRAGENIAAGQQTAEEVVEGWMNSTGHRENILNPDFTEIGIGYELLENDTGSVNYNHYWTQVFGTPLNSNNSGGSDDQSNPPEEQNSEPTPIEDNSSNSTPEPENSDSPDLDDLDQGSNDQSNPPEEQNNELTTVEDSSSNSDSPELEDLDLDTADSADIENSEPGNDAELAPQVAEVTDSDASPVTENNDLTSVETLDNNSSDLESLEDASPMEQDSDSLTNNIDSNIFETAADNSIEVEADYGDDDLTGSDDSSVMTGGNSSVSLSSSSATAQSSGNNFDHSESHSFEDFSFSENSWLGNSDCDYGCYESIVMDSHSDFDFNSSQQQITESSESLL